MFNKNDDRTNETILYQTKPNIILGCKKAIFGLILLVIILLVSPTAIKFIGEMQVYLISYVQLSLTRYAAIAFFVIILINVIYIIWQLVGWYSMEYTLTTSRVIIKSGVLSTKKNYMPYATIQDVNTSQNIFARLFNVGSVSIFSAYDNNLMELSNIPNPSKVEEIIFQNMMRHRNFQPQAPRVDQTPRSYEGNYHDSSDYLGRNDFYDEFEPITPITHERFSNQRREYEYYPEDLGFNDGPARNYEYEAYNDEYETRIPRPLNNQRPPNGYSQGNYYNEVRDEYSNSDDDYYSDYDSQIQYNDRGNDFSQNESNDVDVSDDSSQTVIRRHFDKFKK